MFRINIKISNIEILYNVKRIFVYNTVIYNASDVFVIKRIFPFTITSWLAV